MRPPSYYTSLANSQTNSGRNSSQQLRSSFSSSSSSSYATRTHLPFVPQTMLVAHCYTGVGSSTRPYGQTTSNSLYPSPVTASSRSTGATGSYLSSYTTGRPLSTKRHQSNLGSASSSSYSPSRSAYLSSAGSSSYRRPSAYTYQPIRLRERPLLTSISSQITNKYGSGSSIRPSRPPSDPEPAEKPTEKLAPVNGHKEIQEKRKEEDQEWSRDVARNISRNKYLIKFREIEKPPRASIVPDKDIVSRSEEEKSFDTEEGPNISVTVQLANDKQETIMRVPLQVSLDQPKLALVNKNSPQKSEDLSDSKREECDKETNVNATSDEVKRVKVPKEKRNIRLKIKNVNTPDANVVTVDQQCLDANNKTGKKKSHQPEAHHKDAPTSSSVATNKTKAKRLAKSKVSPEKSDSQDDKGKCKEVSELKAKDSLLTNKKSLSGRKVLEPKQQLNLSNSVEKPPNEQSLAQKAEPATTNKRIRFRQYDYDDFNFLSVLGHGGWGFVILAELKNHDACFAVKCIKKITIVEDDDFESIMIERKVLTLGNVHPFICKLFCTFETEGYLFFAMEYCAGGDLMFHVQREGKFSEGRSRFYAAEIICAIRFLHNQHIIYRDLKLDNILLDSRGHIRLVDFGMCQCRTYREEMLPSNFCGTPEYISPEIIKGVPYNHSVDWWSFGVLLYEMAVGKMPFRGNDENELLWNVCYEQIHYPMFLTKELTSLLQLLLEREPTKRMGMSTCKAGDIYDQAWFKGVDWRAIEELRFPPPFVPDVTSERDVQNFDSDFTQSTPELSPVDEITLRKIDQSQFQKFPYTNPNISIFG